MVLVLFNILENNFYIVKRELPAEKDIIFYLYVTYMPKSLSVCAYPLRRRRLILGRSAESRTPLRNFYIFMFGC